MQFMPWPGKLEAMQLSERDGIRTDPFLFEGYQLNQNELKG